MTRGSLCILAAAVMLWCFPLAVCADTGTVSAVSGAVTVEQVQKAFYESRILYNEQKLKGYYKELAEFDFDGAEEMETALLEIEIEYTQDLLEMYQDKLEKLS